MILVLPNTVTFVAGAPPNVTVAPEAKPLPVIVTVVPPAAGPDDGETPVMSGAVLGVAEKNSAMFDAVAEPPGYVPIPSASPATRSTL